jgi:hypothetical protein
MEFVKLAKINTDCYLKQGDVTVERLKQSLQNAGEQCTICEGTIVVEAASGCRCGVFVFDDTCVVLIHMGAELTNISPATGIEVANECNKLGHLQFCYFDGNLSGQYAMSYEGGLNCHQLVKCVQRLPPFFREAVSRAIA